MRYMLLVGLLLLATPACHAPVTVVTPQGQAAYRADQVVVRINELQNAAIAANTSGALATPTTRVIVEFAVAANRVLATAPAGWYTTVATLWAQTKTQLAGVTNPTILTAIGAVDVVLAAVGGTP